MSQVLGCVIRERDQASIWLLVTRVVICIVNIVTFVNSIVSIVYNCLSRARLSFNLSRNPAAGLASFCGCLSVNLRDQTWESRQICFNCSSQGTINASSAFPASGNSEEIVIEDNQCNDHGICDSDCWLRLTQIQQLAILLCPPQTIIPDWIPTFNHMLVVSLKEKQLFLDAR